MADFTANACICTMALCDGRPFGIHCLHTARPAPPPRSSSSRILLQGAEGRPVKLQAGMVGGPASASGLAAARKGTAAPAAAAPSLAHLCSRRSERRFPSRSCLSRSTASSARPSRLRRSCSSTCAWPSPGLHSSSTAAAAGKGGGGAPLPSCKSQASAGQEHRGLACGVVWQHHLDGALAARLDRRRLGVHASVRQLSKVAAARGVVEHACTATCSGACRMMHPAGSTLRPRRTTQLPS